MHLCIVSELSARMPAVGSNRSVNSQVAYMHACRHADIREDRRDRHTEIQMQMPCYMLHATCYMLYVNVAGERSLHAACEHVSM
jgi:hypothetical protein